MSSFGEPLTRASFRNSYPQRHAARGRYSRAIDHLHTAPRAGRLPAAGCFPLWLISRTPNPFRQSALLSGLHVSYYSPGIISALAPSASPVTALWTSSPSSPLWSLPAHSWISAGSQGLGSFTELHSSLHQLFPVLLCSLSPSSLFLTTLSLSVIRDFGAEDCRMGMIEQHWLELTDQACPPNPLPCM